MKNLKSIIHYECSTSLRYVWIFYAIQYMIVAFITLTIGLVLGSFEDVGTNGLEINTLVYVGIIGILGFNDDFKMLIQNGFSRRYIFIATTSMFCFISAVMALVDTAVGNLIHMFNPNYSSVYGAIYGYNHILMNWIWLFLLYSTVCCLFFCIILTLNKLGRLLSIYLGIIIGGLILLIIALFRYVLTRDMITEVIQFLMKTMGFMGNGTINHMLPGFTFLILIILLASGCYRIIRQTELK